MSRDATRFTPPTIGLLLLCACAGEPADASRAATVDDTAQGTPDASREDEPRDPAAPDSGSPAPATPGDTAGGSSDDAGSMLEAGADDEEGSPGADDASVDPRDAASDPADANAIDGDTALSDAGGAGACEVRQPPAELEATLEATWQEMTGQVEGRGVGARPASASVLTFENTILDQLIETGGTLSYCVRYESDAVVPVAQRDGLERALDRTLNEWFDALQGEDCFPFSRVAVRVVGWAAMERRVFDWPDGDHPGLMYIGDDSFESAPQCAQACGRFFHREPGYAYPQCEGGRDNHYDMSLWLTEGLQGGAGGDWGQRVGRGYFMGSLDQPTLHILSHEVGHGFGFPDYYNWSTWFPQLPVPHSIMVAGAAQDVTEWDTWVFRRTWAELKADRGW